MPRGSFQPVTDMVGGGKFYLQPGQVSWFGLPCARLSKKQFSFSLFLPTSLCLSLSAPLSLPTSSASLSLPHPLPLSSLSHCCSLSLSLPLPLPLFHPPLCPPSGQMTRAWHCVWRRAFLSREHSTPWIRDIATGGGTRYIHCIYIYLVWRSIFFALSLHQNNIESGFYELTVAWSFGQYWTVL